MKTAKVAYTPSVADVTDTITASCEGTTLISKEFYIAPNLTWKWTNLPSTFHIGEKATVEINPTLDGADAVQVTNIIVTDDTGTQLLNMPTRTIRTGETLSYDYTPSNVVSVSFTITYMLNNYSFSEKSVTVPVATQEDYKLIIEDGKLVKGQASNVVLQSENTTLATGSTIEFTSTEGLKASGKLEEK
jgi:hypothetical protein